MTADYASKVPRKQSSPDEQIKNQSDSLSASIRRPSRRKALLDESAARLDEQLFGVYEYGSVGTAMPLVAAIVNSVAAKDGARSCARKRYAPPLTVSAGSTLLTIRQFVAAYSRSQQ